MNLSGVTSPELAGGGDGEARVGGEQQVAGGDDDGAAAPDHHHRPRCNKVAGYRITAVAVINCSKCIVRYCQFL